MLSKPKVAKEVSNTEAPLFFYNRVFIYIYIYKIVNNFSIIFV